MLSRISLACAKDYQKVTFSHSTRADTIPGATVFDERLIYRVAARGFHKQMVPPGTITLAVCDEGTLRADASPASRSAYDTGVSRSMAP